MIVLVGDASQDFVGLPTVLAGRSIVGMALDTVTIDYLSANRQATTTCLS